MTKKELEKTMRDMPITDYEELLFVFGFNTEDTKIMDMRYRDSLGHKANRETIADEAGISVSTLDRKIKAICDRILNYEDSIPLKLA